MTIHVPIFFADSSMLKSFGGHWHGMAPVMRNAFSSCFSVLNHIRRFRVRADWALKAPTRANRSRSCSAWQFLSCYCSASADGVIAPSSLGLAACVRRGMLVTLWSLLGLIQMSCQEPQVRGRVLRVLSLTLPFNFHGLRGQH
jgi:hypothetical protein